MTNKLVDKFKEVVGRDKLEVDECENRVQKEAYVCKRLKKSRSELYELCIATGIDVMYEELRAKGGAR